MTADGTDEPTSWVTLEGEKHCPIRYGQERENDGRPWFTKPCELCGTPAGEFHVRGCRRGHRRYDWLSLCRDCAAPLGDYHVLGCCIERCPRCNGQYMSCGCEGSEDTPDNEIAHEDDAH